MVAASVYRMDSQKKGERGKLPAWLKYLHETTHKYMLNHFKCARAFEA